MSQTSYGYRQQAAVPGGLRDTSPHSIVARANEETEPGAVKFGMGVVHGAVPGANVSLPTAGSTADQFEGIVLTGVKSMDLQGSVTIGETDTLGILKWGRAWVRLASGVASVAYGDALYLVISGDDAGKFTNEESGAIAVNGAFIGGLESGDIAPVELFNQGSALGANMAALDTQVADHEARIAALEA
jgi:hypothetical protein